ncbi:MAG: hypothetical protein ACTSO2_01200 [Promethearchaeota archaeon]
MIFKNISIHSNLFHSIPAEIIFPIAQLKNFTRFDFNEDYILKLIHKFRKKYDLPLIDKFQPYFEKSNLFDSIKQLLKNFFIENFHNQEQLQQIYIYEIFNSFFLNNHFEINDEYQFEKMIDNNNFWNNIFEFLFTFEAPYLVLEIPPLDVPTELIPAELTYFHKFIDKLEYRLKEISKIGEDYGIYSLLYYNPSSLIENNVIYSPFDSFSDFKNFYNPLASQFEYFGLFLDISSFFIAEFEKIAFKLIAFQDPDLSNDTFDNLILFEKYLKDHLEILCKNSNSLLFPLKKLQNIKLIAFNDFDFLNKLKYAYLKLKSPKNSNLTANGTNSVIDELKTTTLSLFKNSNNKLLPGFGSIPINSFFDCLKRLNIPSNIPNKFSLNPKLQIEGFSLENIDWRTIDLKKLNINSFLRQSIEYFIKEKMKQNKENEEQDPLTPNSYDLKNMRVLSFYEIFKILRKYRNILF